MRIMAVETIHPAKAHPSVSFTMEMVRPRYNPCFGYYDEPVEGEPIIRDGRMHPPQGPGCGIRLRTHIAARGDAAVQRTGGDRYVSIRE